MTDVPVSSPSGGDVLALTTEIVSAYLGTNGHVKAEDIPDLIKTVRSALTEADSSEKKEASPAPSMKMDKRAIGKSITPDALISFLDNKPYKTLKRHLGRYGHDMKSYRETYGLPSDYPSVAPNYSAARSAMAKSLGLGARRKGASSAEKPAATVGKQARKSKAAVSES